MNDSPFLDRKESIDVSRRILPHWQQGKKIQFITFRLKDSLPQKVVIELRRKKELFTSMNPMPWDENTTNKYWRLISSYESKYLDAGYGSCILRNATIREIVSNSLHFHDGSKYNLLAYVIMPNHIHLLLSPLEELKGIIQSIKNYTAREINKLINNTGRIWQDDYYDRIIRSEQHFENTLTYIRRNPIHIPADSYSLYINRRLIEDIIR